MCIYRLNVLEMLFGAEWSYGERDFMDSLLMNVLELTKMVYNCDWQGFH